MRQLLFIILLAPFFVIAQNPDPAYVDSLIQLSRAHTQDLDFEPAQETSKAAEAAARTCCGTESTTYADACFNEGRLRYIMGQYDEALPWYLKAKDLREQLLGNQHIVYGKSLNNLAVLYDEMGLYQKAEPIYLEVLALRERNYGRESEAYAASLGNLAGLYAELGEYELAERLELQTIDIRAKVLGKDDPDYATALGNLGVTYYRLGNYDKATQYYLEAIAVQERNDDTESAEYFLGLDNLGVLYLTTQDFVKAETVYQKALSLREKNLGVLHPEYLTSLEHLAILFRKSKRWELSEKKFQELLSSSAKALGNQDLDYGRYLQDYAELCLDKKDYAKALQNNLAARDIFQKQIGKTNALYIQNLAGLLKSWYALGDQTNVERCLTELSKSKKQLLLNASGYLSERELYFFSVLILDNFVEETSFLADFPMAAGTGYNNVLFYKGFLLNAHREVEHLIQKFPGAADNYERLQAARRQLSALYALPLEEQSGLAALEEKANTLEKSLIQQVPDLENAARQVSWQDVQANLKTGEAAIEFTRYRLYHPQLTDSVMYAAFVLLAGTTQPLFIPLFEERQLVSLLQSNSFSNENNINSLYAQGEKGAALFSLIWAPILPHLSGIEKINYAKDGLLHRLNLGAIPATDGQPIVNSFRMVTLNSTRELVHRREKAQDIPTGTASLYGGISYTPTDGFRTDNITAPGLSRQRGLDFSQTDSTLRNGDWKYLPWTEVEIAAVGDLLKGSGYDTSVFTGETATEESIKAMRQSPTVLHIATHGYFFPDPSLLPKTGGNSFKTSEYPMIRSGLALAGANHAWKTGRPLHPGMEDGILTAYEVSQLDLKNTELVVLSACETGLGDIATGEGVYGLQRAFKIAGARYMMMSLWQVPDFQTQAFMAAFYTHFTAEKTSIPEAFRAAQLEMQSKYKDPFLWAGFVLVE